MVLYSKNRKHFYYFQGGEVRTQSDKNHFFKPSLIFPPDGFSVAFNDVPLFLSFRLCMEIKMLHGWFGRNHFPSESPSSNATSLSFVSVKIYNSCKKKRLQQKKCNFQSGICLNFKCKRNKEYQVKTNELIEKTILF